MRKDSYSIGRPASVNIQVYPEDENTAADGKELASDLGISFSELVWLAVEDYVTLHQHIVVNESRIARLAAEYTRARRQNGM